MFNHSGGRARSHRLLRRGGLTGVAVFACAVVCGAAATGAFAAAATTLPAPVVNELLGGPIVPGGPLPPPGTPRTKISQSCPSWLFADPAGFTFTSGNAVLYQPDNSSVPAKYGLPPFDGANVEGNATMSDTGGTATYTGQAHLWYGLSYNASGQFYLGQTLTFKGTDGAGDAISLSGNPGFVVSASGKSSDWGQLTATCS